MFSCEIGKRIRFTNIETKRNITIDDILDLEVPVNILSEIARYKNIFNFTNNIQDVEENMLNSFKEYLELLKVENNKKTDNNQEEDVLLLVIIKS